MFKDRSNQLELLDLEDINKEDLFQNLRELEIINKYLFGIYTSLKGLKKLVTDKNKVYEIYDIGCGGGDFLKEASLWANKNGFKVNITGIDLKDDCIEYAKNYCNGISNIKLIKTDFNDIFFYDNKPDIVHASLFFHHLKDSEIERFLFKIKEEKVSLIINDLIRNRLAYNSIRFLTKKFSKSHLVKNDAPLSVLRGFSKKEWIYLLSKVESLNYSYEIESTIGFRHLVTIKSF